MPHDTCMRASEMRDTRTSLRMSEAATQPAPTSLSVLVHSAALPGDAQNANKTDRDNIK